MLFQWLFGWLMPAPGNSGISGFVLFAVTLILVVVNLVLVGRARRYRLEAERWAMRAEESAVLAEHRRSRS